MHGVDRLPRTSGVYLIACRANGKVYIGSAKNIRKRMNVHLCHLRHREHSSHHLQRTWDKYGPDAFECRVLDECPLDIRIQWEQQYMDLYQSYDHTYGFNINPCAKDQTGRKWTDEQRARQSERQRGVLASEECKARLREGWTRNREIWRAARNRSFGVAYDLLDPNGERVTGQGLTELAERKGLSLDSLRSLVNGHIDSLQGWTRTSDPSSETLSILDPFGVLHEIPKDGLYAFCRRNHLAPSAVKDLMKGGRDECLGWSRPEDIARYTPIEHIDGRRAYVRLDARSHFCNRYGVNSTYLRYLLEGTKDIAEGWCLPARVEHYRHYYRFYCPDGSLISLPWKGLKDWAVAKGLDYYPLLNVSRGRRKEYNGYRRYYTVPQSN